MNWIKNIIHPHSYILFFIVVSVFALIPNGLGWRGDMLHFTQNYVGLSLLYVMFYLFGYYLNSRIQIPEKRDISGLMIKHFHIVYFVCFSFFVLKFIYLSGIPLLNDSPFLRIKMGQLGGFVDFPTKAVALLGIVAYYFFIKRRKYLYLIQFSLTLVLNILFAERSLIIFTLVGALILYLQYYTLSIKVLRIVMIFGFLMLFFIGWVQIIRHGGKENLDKTGKMSGLEVGAWVIHGDLTGSQKFGAYMVDRLEDRKLFGRYTFGMYLALINPNFEDHGAEFLRKKYTDSKTAQSSAIPYSYFMDFGYFSLILPFIIGIISRWLYYKFKTLNSPFYIILYPTYFFALLWSVRSGNFPIDPRFIYYLLVLLFIFSPKFHNKLNNELVVILNLFFLCTILISFMFLIIRW